MSSEEETTEPKTSGDRMTDEQFAEACNAYELGTASLVDLAEKYKVTRQALHGRFKRNGITKGSRKHEVAEAAKKAAQAVAERFADKRAVMIEETRMQGLTALKQARMIGQKIVVEEMRSTTPNLERIDGEIKTIQRYGKFLLDNIEGSLRILNSDEHVDEDDLPNLIVEDLTDQEILDHHKATGALPEDTTLEEMLAEEMDETD